MRIRKEVRAVVYDIKKGEIFILLIKTLHAEHTHPVWRLVKGGIEKGETEKEALEREVYEEVGLELDDLQIIDKLSEDSFCSNGVKHKVSSYAVRTNSKKPLNYNLEEVWGYSWFPIGGAIGRLEIQDEKKAVRYLERCLGKLCSKK